MSSSSSSHASSSSWTSFLKSIANFNGDLSSLTAPPFILSPVSLAEYSQYWAEHPDLLLNANELFENGLTSEEISKSNSEFSSIVGDSQNKDLNQMLNVVKWFVSTLKSQYCSRNESMGSEKKPLNPFLGELFVGKWDHNDDLGQTVCLSEQVSHHPPITAYSIFNEKKNVNLQGYNQIKSTFASASLSVKQYGHAILSLGDSPGNSNSASDSDDTSFLITLPSLHIEGMLMASPFVELDSKSYIQSSKGYFAIFEFTGRGYFSGKKNSFKCKIYKSHESYIADKEGSSSSSSSSNSSGDDKYQNKPIFVITGQWSGVSTLYTSSSDEKKKKNGVLFYDASRVAAEHLQVKPIEEQHEMESRRAWEKVANAIRNGDYNLIHEEKSKLEDTQRALRKEEQEKNIKWQQRWFKESGLEDKENSKFIKLAGMCKLSTKNVPSGTRVGDKHDVTSAASDDSGKLLDAHWRFIPAKWTSESEVKL